MPGRLTSGTTASASAEGSARLGLLAHVAAGVCTIDGFGHGVGGAELRVCVGKRFARWEECAGTTRAVEKRGGEEGLRLVPLVEPRSAGGEPAGWGTGAVPGPVRWAEGGWEPARGHSAALDRGGGCNRRRFV